MPLIYSNSLNNVRELVTEKHDWNPVQGLIQRKRLCFLGEVTGLYMVSDLSGINQTGVKN